jgi:hypothetical protein
VTKWFEAYRGVVNSWECDIVKHLTIGYYFEFFAAATRNLFDLLGEEADACLLASPARRHRHRRRCAAPRPSSGRLGYGQDPDLARRAARAVAGLHACHARTAG